ncbi:MAG: hypothetical protein LBQ96_06360 [Fusobacteriaceae bacterium]|nr:hypothetical protein [Fusobacteriaceae bacterium]
MSITARVFLEGKELVCESFLRKKRYAIADIHWAYAQMEDVNVTLCCGKGQMEIYRLILRMSGEKVALEFENKKQVDEILEQLKAVNPEIVIGYNKNREEAFRQNSGEFVRLSNS